MSAASATACPGLPWPQSGRPPPLHSRTHKHSATHLLTRCQARPGKPGSKDPGTASAMPPSVLPIAPMESPGPNARWRHLGPPGQACQVRPGQTQRSGGQMSPANPAPGHDMCRRSRGGFRPGRPSVARFATATRPRGPRSPAVRYPAACVFGSGREGRLADLRPSIRVARLRQAHVNPSTANQPRPWARPSQPRHPQNTRPMLCPWDLLLHCSARIVALLCSILLCSTHTALRICSPPCLVPRLVRPPPGLCPGWHQFCAPPWSRVEGGVAISDDQNKQQNIAIGLLFLIFIQALHCAVIRGFEIAH